MNVLIIIPVCNPDCKLKRLFISLQEQLMPNFRVLIIDSGNDERYKEWIFDKYKVQVKKIVQSEFNHGRTRQMGINNYPKNDIYVFLTQDAVLADKNALNNMISVFSNSEIGCAYGRQLPHQEANFFAASARKINYPDKSYVRSWNDRHKFGIKTPFISNSFAAYRREAMESVGGFPDNIILGEDMWVAAKMLISGWRIAYVADAKVYHSHNYSIMQEFKRYFDMGVFHSREKWIKQSFGSANGSGIKFVKDEISMIQNKEIREQINLLVRILARDCIKFFGYKLGGFEKYIKPAIKRHLSMTKNFW